VPPGSEKMSASSCDRIVKPYLGWQSLLTTASVVN
jgi:hypothetical protein